MKNKFYLIIIFSFACLINLNSTSYSNDILIDAETVDIKEKGNLIFATGNVNITDGTGAVIKGDKAIYNKYDQSVEISGNVFFSDNIKNFNISSDKVLFEKQKNIISTFNNTIINLLDQNNGNIEFEIKGKNSIFDQKKKILEINKDVILIDLINNYQIYSQKIIYDIKNELIKSQNETEINFKNKINILSSDIIFNEKEGIFQTKKDTILKDKFKNVFSASGFQFNTKDNLFKGKNIKLSDKENNKLEAKYGYINFETKELVGSDFTFKFNKSVFGNSENDPRLVGTYIITDLSKTKMKKSSFTTCKNIDGKCPAWSISANEVNHLKEKKIIEYKNAWLEIYDMPVAYFPYFFHPDPSVKRQSGFLFPQFINSSNLGFSAQIPYYKVIDIDKDMTISPRVYTNDNFFVQTEYRQIFKNSSLTTDFSYNRKDNSNTHFFSTLKGDLENSFYEMKIESVSNNNYLKQYQIQSPLIDNFTTLNSSFAYEKYDDDYNFSSSFNIIEDLSKSKNDRYEYIFPNFEYNKETFLDGNFFDTFNFKSSGNYHKYNTNVDELDFINDFNLNANIRNNDSNFDNNIKFLIRNINTYGDLSQTYKDDLDYKVQSTLLLNTKYPLIKESDFDKNFLTPMIALRYSPNKGTNQKNEKILLNFHNLFDLDRINNKTIEHDGSLTLGLEYKKENKLNNEKLKFGTAVNFRSVEDQDLPISSSLGKKTSDLIGYSGINVTENLSFDYNFILDQNLSETNYSLASLNYNNNKFNTSFEFMEKSEDVGDESYLINKTNVNFNRFNSFAFETNKNLDKNLTDYYNLIYKYKNDCLEASLIYNRQFYNEDDVNPEKNIFFKISFIPFGELNTPNLND